MWLTILNALLLGILVQPAPPAAVPAATVVKQIAGVWKADEDRTPRVTDLDVQVFGQGAFDVRDVTLTITPSGEGRLKISTAVVGKAGRRFAPSVVDATLKIGDPVTMVFGHQAPTVTVVSAEEKYLDGTKEQWAQDGSRSSISVTSPTELEFRYDTRDGRGSFGTTLKRQR
jgi:hypothetical protein